MKRFLFKSILFFGVLAIVMVATDLWISKTLATSESYSMGDAKVWQDILKGQINEDLLIYGSSRAWRHFDPEFIEAQTGLTAYNFGVDGHAFDIQYLRHELNLKYNKAPKVIIYSVDYNTLNAPSGLYNDEQFLPFFFADTLLNAYTKKYENFSFIDYKIPLLRYSGREKALTYFVKEVIGWPQTKMRSKGFGVHQGAWNSDYKKAKAKKGSVAKEIHKENVKRFDAFLKEAYLKNISVILMYTPEHVLGQELIANREEIVKVFDSLANKNNIPFFDYSKDSMNSNKVYFYNSLHLNAQGVEKFNNLYIPDLKTYLDTMGNN